jgi:hypothetical protein
MTRFVTIAGDCLAVVLASGLLAGSSAQVAAQAVPGNAYGRTAIVPQATAAADQQGRAVYQLAERSETVQPAATPQLSAAQSGEHPLMPVLRWAQSGVGNVEKLQDYSATMVKRERIGGKVGDYNHMFVKVRHRPFSVYLYFLTPQEVRGQEVIYNQGQNNGKMLAHTVGLRDKVVGTVSLKPDGVVAMQGNRYPLTEIGILNLINRLVEVGEKDVKYGECNVKFYKGAKINNRVCTCIEVAHPTPRRNFLFNVARIFVDDELNLPIRYESYDWPKEPGGSPELLEEYTYLNLKLNNGFTDADFDVKNPNYRFH